MGPEPSFRDPRAVRAVGINQPQDGPAHVVASAISQGIGGNVLQANWPPRLAREVTRLSLVAVLPPHECERELVSELAVEGLHCYASAFNRSQLIAVPRDHWRFAHFIHEPNELAIVIVEGDFGRAPCRWHDLWFVRDEVFTAWPPVHQLGIDAIERASADATRTPPEFPGLDARAREPQFVPDPDFISLLSAMDAVGEYSSPKFWTGEERYARSDEWRRSDTASMLNRLGTPSIAQDPAGVLGLRERAARKRRDSAYETLRRLMYAGSVRTAMLSSGKITRLPSQYWATDEASDSIETGWAAVQNASPGDRPGSTCGWVLVHRGDLETAVLPGASESGIAVSRSVPAGAAASVVAESPPPSAARRIRRRNPAVAADRRNRIDALFVRMRRRWPSDATRPSSYQMAKELVRGEPGGKLFGFSEETIRKILRHDYPPAQMGTDPAGLDTGNTER